MRPCLSRIATPPVTENRNGNSKITSPMNSAKMELASHFLSIKNSPFLLHRPFKTLTKPLCSLPVSAYSKLSLAHSLQADTLQTLEWSSLCTQLSRFTSTSMGRSVAQSASIPIGKSPEESQKLLDQTTAALAVMQSGPLDLSGFEDITEIVNSAVSGTLLTARELCAVRRTLRAARAMVERLMDGGDGLER